MRLLLDYVLASGVQVDCVQIDNSLYALLEYVGHMYAGYGVCRVCACALLFLASCFLLLASPGNYDRF